MSCENKKTSCCDYPCNKKCSPLVDKLKSISIFQKLLSCSLIASVLTFLGSILCLMLKILLFPIKLALALFFLILILKSCGNYFSKSDLKSSDYHYTYKNEDCFVEIKNGNVIVNGCKTNKQEVKPSNSSKKNQNSSTKNS